MGDQDGYFGEGVAARYDESLADMCEPDVVDAVVEVLAGLAGGGRALELGIGIGRIALPLARRGVAPRLPAWRAAGQLSPAKGRRRGPHLSANASRLSRPA
jgi:hypothetical protein